NTEDECADRRTVARASSQTRRTTRARDRRRAVRQVPRAAGGAAHVSNPELIAYYKARAVEYERVYEKPERQADLRRLHETLPPLFEGRRVLELACGTGYWTRRLIPHVASLTGVDAAPETLLVARANQPKRDNVALRVGDVYDLAKVPG